MQPGTRIRSTLMRIMTSDTRRRFSYFRGSLKRRLSGGTPTVHYFHQVDDPYSHLAIQKLDQLWSRYRVGWKYHLVSPPLPEYQGDSDRFNDWALRDARSIAEFYGADLPGAVDRVVPSEVSQAECILSDVLHTEQFTATAIEVGTSLWKGESLTPGGARNVAEVVVAGNRLRERLGHYLGAMFYFEGEWYWGLDRLYHLENRLCDMGLSLSPDSPICVPRPAGESATGKQAARVTLEVFPSLRSPYTAISFDRVMELVNRSGVTLELKPVMPMMMRGIPAPRAKQIYILTDTKREADAAGVPFGRMVDPFGEPVRRAFSLYPWVCDKGKQAQYLSSYLSAAFAEAVDITTDAGLEEVITGIGLDWEEAKQHLDSGDWQALLERNVDEMLEAGLWGVPSFRVTGGDDDPFCCWGQDRLWRVETEIARRAARTAL